MMNDLADSHLRRRLFDLIFSFLVFNFVGKPRKTKLECFSWPHFNVLFQSSFDNFFVIILSPWQHEKKRTVWRLVGAAASSMVRENSCFDLDG
jgi:hypothetical protein